MESQSRSLAQYEKLKALHLHANNLADARSIEEIIEHTADAMGTTLGFSWGIFSIVEDNLLKFTMPKSLGGSGERWDLPLDGPGITVRTARTGETQLIADIREDVDFIGGGMDDSTRSRLDGTHPKRDERTHSLLAAREPALSELDVPVKIGQSVVAVIGAESTELNAFTEQDQELLETLASHVASAIQRIRLLEAQLQYEEKLEALHRHANGLADSTTLKEIAEYTIEAMYATLGMKSCDFLIRENQHLRLINYRGWVPSDPDRIFPLDGPGILVKVANTKKSIVISDVREDPSYVEYKGKQDAGDLAYQPRSELCVPVISDGEVIAVLNTESNQLDYYDARDQVLFETLANHVALNIQRIRFLEAQIQYEAKLETLHQHANKLANATSIEEIRVFSEEALMSTVRTNLKDGSGGIGFVEDNVIKYPPPANFPELPLDGPGITARAVRTGETQLVNDTRKDVDFIGLHMDDAILSGLEERHRKRILENRESGNKGILSELEVPVKIGDTVFAVLSGESTELNAFNEQDQKLLETLASHIASAIQRIRTKEEVRQLAYKLNNLKPGGSYLSESHDRCLKAYAVLSMEGVPGLSIVRDDPQRLVDDYGIKKEEIVLLSSRPFDGYETLEGLQAVSRALSQFLESGEGVVLLDGLEYLISRFGFEAVYSFVQEKRFDFLKSKAVLLVPLEMKTLKEQERALLSSEFTLLE